MKKKINWLVIGLLVFCCIGEGAYIIYSSRSDVYGKRFCSDVAQGSENYELTYVEGNSQRQPIVGCSYGSGGGGANTIAVRENGQWKVILGGVQDITQDQINKYNLPVQITGPQI